MAPVPSSDTTDHPPKAHASTDTSNATASTITPPFRSSISDEDNPFIQFRRFADSQISSLLQSIIGLPSLFERPSATARWIVIQKDGDGNEFYVNGDKVTMRQRREREEGWWKQKEQGPEEQARAPAAVRKDEVMKSSDHVDGQAAPRQLSSEQVALLPDESTASTRNGALLDWLGWDGSSRKPDDTRKGSASSNGLSTTSSIRMSTNEKDSSLSLNPFSGRTSEAVHWLLTNEYSPVFLRGYIPEDVHRRGPSFSHALYHPHWPDCRATSLPDRFEDELRFRVPWCDAFEDLVSLQNNGHMLDRDEPTRTSSARWLNDMVKRGSLGEMKGRGALGPQWATEYDRAGLSFAHNQQPVRIRPSLIPPSEPIDEILGNEDGVDADPVLSAFEIIQNIAGLGDTDGKELLGYPKHWIQEFGDSPIQAVAKDLMRTRVPDELRQLGFTSDAQVIEHLFGDLVGRIPGHGFLMTPPDVIAAAMRAAAASEIEPRNTGMTAEETHHGATWGEKETQVEAPEEQAERQVVNAREKHVHTRLTDHSPNTEEADEITTFSSPSLPTCTWSRWGTAEESRDSIVSTMTTTERRTLPDGTVETRRVLKKRFADGREESNESVERQKSTLSDTPLAVSKAAENETSSPAKQDKQTQTLEEENPRPTKSGWFWRE